MARVPTILGQMSPEQIAILNRIQDEHAQEAQAASELPQSSETQVEGQTPTERRTARTGRASAPEQPSRAQDTRSYEERVFQANRDMQTISGRVKAALDGAMTLLTGAVAEPTAGIAGLFTYLAPAPEGNDTKAYRATRTIEAWQQGLQWSPKTDAVQVAFQVLSEPMGQIDSAIQEVSSYAAQGNPYAAAAIYTTLMALPELVESRAGLGAIPGVRNIRSLDAINTPRGRTRGAINRRYRELRRFANENGIDLVGTDRRQSMANALNSAAPERVGEVERVLPEALRQLDAVEWAYVNHLYDTARATGPATINPMDVDQFVRNLRNNRLSDYGTVVRGQAPDYSEMKILQARLDELSSLSRNSQGRFQSVDIERLIDIQRRARRQMPPYDLDNRPPPEVAALNILNHDIDQFLINSMVSGDPKAVQAWMNASKAAKDYYGTFTDNAILNSIIAQELSANGVKNAIFGANAALMKPRQTLQVVDRIVNIFGLDSPQVAALRAEVVHDIVKGIPLDRSATPSQLEGFLRNLDEVKRRNWDVMERIGLDVSQFETLGELVNAAIRKGDMSTWRESLPRVSNIIASLGFGHEIAKQGLKVRLARTIMSNVFNAGDGVRRQQILYEAINEQYRTGNMPGTMDPGSALFDPLGIAAAGVITDYTLEQLGIENREDEFIGNIGPE